MDRLNELKNIFDQYGGIVKTSILNSEGFPNYELSRLSKDGYISRIRHGYYQLAETEAMSEEQLIASLFPESIVCMESALFYYGYSDKTPLVWTLAVPRTISRSKLQIKNLAYKLYFINNSKFELGKSSESFNGVKLPVYDRERTLCDCFKYRTKIDAEMFNKAIYSYVSDSHKNLDNLSKYAMEMGIYKKVMELMEVMLNE